VTRRPNDLAGTRFGRLVAREPTDERSNDSVVWLCDCDCGTKGFRASARRLADGRVRSCGCLIAEMSERVDAFVAHARRGWPVSRIAKKFKVSRQAVFQGLGRRGIPGTKKRRKKRKSRR